MVLTQTANLAVVATSNIVAIVAFATHCYWLICSRSLRQHPRLTLHVIGMAVMAGAIWYWSGGLMIDIVLWHQRLAGDWLSSTGRIAIMLALGFQSWVVTKVYPVPQLDGV